jgi:probable O-glycosylation ligase (exosortase A-associated)
MLRLIFVFLIIAAGTFFAAQAPFYALLFYLWNAYFRPEDWTYGGLIRSLHLSFVIGVYLVLRTAVSLPKLRINLGTALILLFLAQAILGTVQSEHPLWSWSFLSDFFKVLLITYLIVVLVTDRKKYRLTLLVIALSLGFEGAKQGWLGLYRSPGAKNDNNIIFLGDNNGVALGMMMLVPILGALAQTAAHRWERYTHRFLQIGVFMRGFTTYSRGGFLAAGVLGLLTLVRSERKIRALVGIVAVVALVWTVMPQSFWDRMNTITAPSENRDDSAAGRLHFWQVAVEMANAKPFTGVGLNGFEPSYETYNASQEFGGVRATHSAWFGVLADLGYSGLILLIANLIVATWSCWRVHRWSKRDPTKRDLRLYANALITSFASFAVAATFLSQQYSEMFWHFVGLSTALQLVTADELAATDTAASEPQPSGRPAVAAGS